MAIRKLIYIKLFFVLILFTIIHMLIKKSYLSFFNDNSPSEIYISQLSSSVFTVNNILFRRQRNFDIPKNNHKIFGRLKFRILPTNSNTDDDDRIYSQMRYVPASYSEHQDIKEKLILLYTGMHHIHFGNFEICPVSKCKITTDREKVLIADIILWIREIEIPFHKRPSNQIWSILFHESPMNTFNVKYFEKKTKSNFNWTITYRPDSTIPHPYYKYSPYDLINPTPLKYPLTNENYAYGKTKLVAWFVSNCQSTNKRNEIVEKIQKYIQIDIYGRCGKLSCPRKETSSCFDMLKKTYKFYLAFENSNCRHYITEKFFLNGLSNNVIPIVLGAHPDDYKRVAPPHSYIHIEDFSSIKDLVDYMISLNKNDTAYNEYFSWKNYGTVHFKHYFHCRLCMMAHESSNTHMYYSNVNKWWKGENKSICLKIGSWKYNN